MVRTIDPEKQDLSSSLKKFLYALNPFRQESTQLDSF